MKKLFSLIVLSIFSIVLVACDNTVELTSVSFEGVANITVDFDADFNVKDGVTAKGDDDKDYTDQIVFSTTSSLVATDGSVDTKTPGSITVLYTVTIDEEEMGRALRTITISEPEKVEGYLQNGDMTDGAAFWNKSGDGKPVSQVDGGVIAIGTEDGALKVDYTAGWGGPHTARFGQDEISTELGETYEVTFRAKTLDERRVNIQVGELLPGAPWFYDFLPGVTIQPTITTEWQEFSFKFTVNPLEKDRDGITQADGKYTNTALLFGLGALGSELEYNGLVSTIWFDDFTMEIAEPDADTTAPVITVGAANKEVRVDDTFNPASGVTANDIVDGDLTASVTYVVKKGEDVVTTIDTSVVGTVYTITYSVSDAAGNEATATVTLTVVAGYENLVADLDSDGHTLEQASEFTFGSMTKTDDGLEIVITEVGGEPYIPHYFYEIQDGLEAGTYTFTLKVTSNVTRDLRTNIILPDGGFVSIIEGGSYDQEAVADELTTITFEFTVENAISQKVKIELDFGNLGGELVSLPGTFVISEVTLVRK